MVILICIVIFFFSNQVGEESSKIASNLFIRKLGHFSEYAILGFFVFAYFSNFLIQSAKGIKTTVFVSLVAVVLYAASDEFHQTFVPGRDGNIKDVLIDSSGGFFGIIISLVIFYLVFLKKSKKSFIF